MSLAEGALASLMKPVRCGGSGQDCQREPFHRSATGALAPPGLVPPNTQAVRRPVVITAE